MKSLLDIEYKLATSASDQLVLTHNTDSLAIASYVVRGIKGRADIAHVINLSDTDENSFISKIEQIRTQISLGKIDRAQQILKNMKSTNSLEKIELDIERCRINILQNRFLEALDLANKTIISSSVFPVSKMTLLQMIGHIHISLNNFNSAIECLVDAVHMSELYPNVHSAYSCQAFLIISYAKSGKKEKSSEQLKYLKQRLNLINDSEVWPSRYLIYLRAKYFYLFHFESSSETIQTLLEAKLIANWLNDNVTEEKCINDLKQFPIDDITAHEKGFHLYDSWAYLSRCEIILSYVPKKIFVLNNSPITQKMILKLVKGSISQSDFFHDIWNIKFNPEVHGNHVRANLSKLRKILPKGSLVLKEDMISLT